MPKIFIPIIVFGAFYLFSLIKRLLTKGCYESAFFQKDGENIYLYQYVDYIQWNWARSGSYETHRTKLRKTDLQSLTPIYYKKISSFASSTLHGGSNIIAFDGKYIFFNINGFTLIIVDSFTGERIAKNKRILRNNLEFDKINVEDIYYSPEFNSIISSDKIGTIRQLDPKTLRFKETGKNPDSSKFDEMYICLKDLPGINLEKHFFTSANEMPFYVSRALNVDFISVEGSSRKYISISESDKSGRSSNMKESFLCPKILSFDNEKHPYVELDYPSLIVIHCNELNSPAGKLIISAIKGNSEMIWSHKLAEMFKNPKKGKNHQVSYYETDKHLFFILLNGACGYKQSICKVEKFSGNIINSTEFINRQIGF